MRLPNFEYVELKTLEEAATALDAEGSVLIAGGTDLLVNMKNRLTEPRRIINLKAVPNLTYVSAGEDGLRIGALTTLHDLASSPIIQEAYPAISHAAREAGSYGHQVAGTVGGNLCQSNRCRYYNQSAFWRNAKTPCYKAGGEFCYVVRKPAVCYATYCGDLAPALVALDSRIKVVGPDGERTFPLIEMYTQDGMEPLSLRKGEIVTEVHVPPPSGKALYLKLRFRDSIEFPVISVAVHLSKDGNGHVKKARIVFSAVGSGPVKTPESEKMLEGMSLSDEVIERVSTAVVKEITPLRTSNASPAYKRRMARTLLRQALEDLRT